MKYIYRIYIIHNKCNLSTYIKNNNLNYNVHPVATTFNAIYFIFVYTQRRQYCIIWDAIMRFFPVFTVFFSARRGILLFKKRFNILRKSVQRLLIIIRPILYLSWYLITLVFSSNIQFLKKLSDLNYFLWIKYFYIYFFQEHLYT